jgi:pimeloyl-ACP methyl ester carboxylesterase
MDEASSRFVDRIAVEKLLQDKLSKVHHGQSSSLSEADTVWISNQDPWPYLRSYPSAKARATILFAHGLFEDQRDIYRFLFAGLNRRGYSVALYCLPYHYERKPADSLFSGEYFFSADLHRTRRALLQAGKELRTCYGRLARQTGGPVFLAGFSMGATVTLLAAIRLNRGIGACLLNPPANLADLVWTSPLCQTIRADLEVADVDQTALASYFQDIDPLRIDHGSVDKGRLLMIQATYDLVTSQEQYEALAAGWRLPHRLKYHAGHLNTLRVPRLAEDMARFFDAQISLTAPAEGCPR